MNTIEEKLNHLNELVINGKLIEAFDLYYGENVAMQENSLPPTVGKEENRKRELQFLSDVTDFRKAEVVSLAANGTVSYVTWSFDYTHKEWGVRNYTQVSVQHWKDGKIQKEQFFYSN